MDAGKKKVTLTQIAQRAQVSLATVSRVLNNLDCVKGDTYERVMVAARELGYPLKETMGAQPVRGGLIIFNLPSIDNPFYSEIVRGTKTSAAQHGFHLLINEEHLNRGTLSHIQQLIKKTKAVGIIITNNVSHDILKALAEITLVVQCCEYDDTIDLPYVSIDDLSASRGMMQHLLSRGCRRIAFISGPARYKYARHRLQGYRMALEEASIPVDPRLVVQLPDISFDLSISATMQLLNSDNPPDAFFTCSDVYAFAAVRAAHLAGFRVPKDVRVTGFDNIESSSMSIPSITTVSQPRAQLGYMACELLLEKLYSPNIANKKVVLETELILREST